MACFAKYKRGNVAFLIGHAFHKYKARDGHIDQDLTVYNTNYIQRDLAFLNSRLQEIGCSNRADANVFAELIVSKPKHCVVGSGEFFDCIFEFAKLNYKEQNIVYAVVHRDEPFSQEHIHIGFIPTHYDNKKKKVFVSYDKCVYRKIDTFHQKLSEYCEKTFGVDVGIINGATKDGNKSIDQLKLETAIKEDIERLQQQKAQALREAEEALSIDQRIIVAKYKAENDRLRRDNRTYFEFIKANNLIKLFKEWFAKITNKTQNKEYEK